MLRSLAGAAAVMIASETKTMVEQRIENSFGPTVARGRFVSNVRSGEREESRAVSTHPYEGFRTRVAGEHAGSLVGSCGSVTRLIQIRKVADITRSCVRTLQKFEANQPFSCALMAKKVD